MTRVAFLINAYRSPIQVERLVRTLSHAEGTAFLIHLDRKSGPQIEAELRASLADLDNVHFTARKRVYWGRFSVVAASLRGLEAIDEIGLDPDQTVLLSGQDYPIKSPDEIAGFLSAHAGDAFIEHFPIPSLEHWPVQRGGLDRIEFVHLWIPRRGPSRLPIRRIAKLGVKPYGGSAHLALGREHRRYVADLVRDQRKLVRFFRLADVPDELFFQTVLMNSPLRDRVINDNLFDLHFEPGANHPTLLTSEDLPRLADSAALFARKFDSEKHPAVLDLLDSQLLGGPARSTAHR